MLFHAETMIHWMLVYFLPLVRLSSFLMVLSIISSHRITPRFRLLLAFSILIAIMPTLPKTSLIFHESDIVGWFSIRSGLQVIREVLIGLALGFVSRLFMETFAVAGQILAMQSGLGFASLIDPENGNSVPALGQFFLMMASLLFLGFDGHLVMLRLVIESFHSFPIGSEFSLLDIFMGLVLWGKWIFSTALMMAIVAITALLMINLAFGVMSRAAPQINIFSVGFPLTMVIGLLFIWLNLMYFLPHIEEQFKRATSLMCQMVHLNC
jgi:flagellar biosynthetic protein FliR